MAEKVNAIPDGLHSVTPNLTIKDASKAIDWYQKTLGAEELYRMPGPDGRLMHAEIKIGNAVVMITDEMPEMGGKGPQALGGTPVSLMIYSEDSDALSTAPWRPAPPCACRWKTRSGATTGAW